MTAIRLGCTTAAIASILLCAMGLEPAAADAPMTGPSRVLEARILSSEGFRQTPQWRGVARRVIEEATSDLEMLAGIRVTVAGEREWEPPSGEALPGILEALRREHAGSGELLIAFLGPLPHEEVDPDALQGFAAVGRPFVILTSAPAEDLAATLRHELGHVFALPHIPGRNVMNPHASERARDFDALSVELLRATRNLDFTADTPFTGCDLETIRDVFLIWERKGIGRPLQMLNLGIAFRREGLPEDAATVLEAAVRLDPESAPAWYHLGRARRTLGDRERAAEAFRTCLELDPEGPESASARELLGSAPAPGVR